MIAAEVMLSYSRGWMLPVPSMTATLSLLSSARRSSSRVASIYKARELTFRSVTATLNSCSSAVVNCRWLWSKMRKNASSGLTRLQAVVSGAMHSNLRLLTCSCVNSTDSEASPDSKSFFSYVCVKL